MTTGPATRTGSLCSGYEGIGLGVGGQVVYVCDPEPAAATVLAAHHPDAPNLHDLKALAWSDMPVDLLTAGYPCQPFSGAGKRAGTDDPRHLWPWIAQGIARSRPPLVLLENVRGHLSLGWDTVLLDLHRLGYDVRWTLIRAADVGAPHGRARLFALAADRDAQRWSPAGWMPVARCEDNALVHPEDGLFGAHPLPVADNGHVPMWAGGLMVDGIVWEQQPLIGNVVLPLLPTPAVNDMGKAYSPDEWDAWCAKQQAAHGNGNGHGPSLEVEAARLALLRLLPTPTTQDASNTAGPSQYDRNSLPLNALAPLLLPTPRATDGEKGGPNQAGSSGDLMLPSAVQPERWGRYAAAVARCEALTRPAPSPTLPTGKGGAQRLSPPFVEWMMMLPEGWVTDPALWTHLKPSAARNVQLKLLGNGVVPAQASAAWQHLTTGLTARRVAA